MSNYDEYYDPYSGGCGTGATGCGTCPTCPTCPTGGCNDYQTCSPDYNPVTVNNSTCPNVEGGSSQGGNAQGGSSQGGNSQGGNASGNTSNLSVSICGGNTCYNSCCFEDGVMKLLKFLYKESLDTSADISVNIYGNILVDQEDLDELNPQELLGLNNEQLQNICLMDGIISSSSGVVIICSISIIVFDFDESNQNSLIKQEFSNIDSCSCNCSCNSKLQSAIAQNLCSNGLGGTYEIVLNNTLFVGKTDLATLEDLVLVALDNNIAIFSNSKTDPTVYYGIPISRIAKIVKM